MFAKKILFLLCTACLLLSAVPDKLNYTLAASKTDTSSNRPWKNKKCAVVITYDDAINEHLDNAIPVLDSLGLKATFYLTAYSPACAKRLKEWRTVAASGHELGNHTLFHPCMGNMPGREWVSKERDMNTYTVQRMTDEIKMTNTFLEAIDGKTTRTFAFTCGDMKIGDSSFMNGLKNDFTAARAVRHEMHAIDQIDLYNMDCYVVNNNTAEQMTEWVKKATETNSLLVILFHGVGGGNALNVSLPAHRQFLSYLKQQENEIWVAPAIEVAEYVKTYQQKQ
jgi:peptidoglycan-N-acetylglucosamine deacetylase